MYKDVGRDKNNIRRMFWHRKSSGIIMLLKLLSPKGHGFASGAMAVEEGACSQGSSLTARKRWERNILMILFSSPSDFPVGARRVGTDE